MLGNILYMLHVVWLRKIATTFILLIAGTLLMAQSQDTICINLSQAIEIALQQSPTARSARHSFLVQHWNYRYYCANYLPSVTLSSSPYINNVINKITNGSIGIEIEKVIANIGFPIWTKKLGFTFSKISNNVVNITLITILVDNTLILFDLDKFVFSNLNTK